MTVTIDDDDAMRRMESAIRAVDGNGVARDAVALFRSGKHAVVRRVCLRTCHLAHPRHCRALIAALVPAPRSRAAKNMSDALATIVSGVRENAAPDTPDVAPLPLTKRPRDAIAVAARDGRCPIDNLGSLPARMGRDWGGIADLVARACADDVHQEDAVANARLEALFARPPPPAIAKGARGASQWTADASSALRYAAIWAYTRRRSVLDRAALAAGETRREAAAPPKSVRIDDPAALDAGVAGTLVEGRSTYVRDVPNPPPT